MSAIQALLASYPAGSTAPSIVLVQQKTATASSTSLSGSFNTPLTAGNSIIAVLSNNQGDPYNSVAVGAESLSLVKTIAASGAKAIYAKHNVTGGETGFSLNIDDPGRINAIFMEFSGLKNQAAESTNNNSGVASSTVTIGSVTPTSANNLIIGGGFWTVNDYSSGPTNGFTRATNVGGTGQFQEVAYLIQSAATANSTGWGLTAGINWEAVIAAFGAN